MLNIDIIRINFKERKSGRESVGLNMNNLDVFIFRPKPIDSSSVSEDEQVIRRRRRMPRQVSMISDGSEKNKSFREWFTSIFTMSDVDIINRCGLDALQYLRFQRHIIFYVTMTMVLSISIILPLNFQGNEELKV